MVLAAVPAFGAGETLNRIAGANRWATAVEISKKGWSAADVVVLANGQNYPDALAGVPLAHTLGGPVLLTEANSLVPATKAEIQRLGATKVVILGGTGVVSAAVATELEGLGLTVERISGADRYATAAAVAAKAAPGGAGTVVLAYGQGFADALAAASYAAINGYPILLTKKDELPAATKTAIETLGATKVLVVGGTGVIADSTVADLPGVTRIAGSNREATSVALANHFALQTTNYYLATGDGFADAITGAVLAAKEGTGILLVRGSFPAVVGEFFTNKNVATAVIFGGAGVVSETVAQAAAAKLVQAPSGIAGFILDGADDPVKDAVVAVAGKEAKTDATGFYQLTGVVPGKYTVTLSKPGFEIVTETNFVVAQNKVATLNLTLGASLEGGAVSITGVVYDAETFASVAADVVINRWDKTAAKWVAVVDGTGTVGVDSKFTITTDNLKANTEYQVVVSRDVVDYPDDAYKSQTRTFKTDAYKTANVIAQPFALQPVKPVTISGTILDKVGGKVAGSVVELYLGEDYLGEATAAAGEYDIEDLTLPSGNYTLVTSLVDNALYTATVTIAEGVDKTHNIKLVAGYPFTFTAAADLGETLQGPLTAQVYQGTTKVGAAVAGVLAGDSLTADFAMADLYPVGNYTVEVSGSYVVTGKTPVSITKAGLSFTGRAVLAGTAAGNVGVSVPDINVALINSAGKEVAAVKTAADGSFVFNGVPAGTKYKVTASHPSYVTKSSTVFNVTAKGDAAVPAFVLVLVATTATYEGYLRDAETMELLDDVAVDLIDKDGDWPYGDDFDGDYILEDIAPGTYTMVVHAPGYEYHIETITVVAKATPVTKHIFLKAGGNASLTIKSIKDSKGVDVAILDAKIVLEDDYWVDDNPTSMVFSDLPASTYTLYIEVPAGYLPVEQTITLTKGQNRELNIVLVSANKVELPVYGGAFPGSLLPDAKVLVYDLAGKLVASEKTDAGGIATFALVNGSYNFKVYADGHYVGTASATISKEVKLAPIYVEPF